MKTCKDCLHYEACKDKFAGLCRIRVEEPKKHLELDPNVENRCLHFTDRSEWVHLLCKVGDAIYYPWVFNRSCGIAVGEVESIKIYADNKPLFITKDWESDMPMQGTFISEDFGDIVFLNYDEAEKALERMQYEDT